MTELAYVGLALLIIIASLQVEYAQARYVGAVTDGRPHMAAVWSVSQWVAASIGFVVAVRVSLWFLPAEAFGIYVGTWLGARREARGVTGG